MNGGQIIAQLFLGNIQKTTAKQHYHQQQQQQQPQKRQICPKQEKLILKSTWLNKYSGLWMNVFVTERSRSFWPQNGKQQDSTSAQFLHELLQSKGEHKPVIQEYGSHLWKDSGHIHIPRKTTTYFTLYFKDNYGNRKLMAEQTFIDDSITEFQKYSSSIKCPCKSQVQTLFQ